MRSALARIGADELDVSIDRIRVETADTAHGLDEGETAGSMSIEQSGVALRQAAAEARAHLLALAADELGRRMSTSCASTTEACLPVGARRPTGSSSVAGSSRSRRPVPSRRSLRPEQGASGATGRRRPCRRSSPERRVTSRTSFCPRCCTGGGSAAEPGAVLDSVDESACVGLPGVVAVVRDGSFLGVIAEREEQALAAADVLAASARWTERIDVATGAADWPHWLRDEPAEEYLVVDGVAVEGRGAAVVSEPDGAVRTLRRDLHATVLLHGAIGPSAAVARWSDGETRGVVLDAGSLSASACARRRTSRRRVGACRVQHVEGPGCYGHNGADDVALDAALLARAANGRPVRVVFSREQEHAWEPYGPAADCRAAGESRREGRLLDWNHDVWSNSHDGRPSAASPGTSALAAAWFSPIRCLAPVPKPSSGFHGGIHRNADPLYAVPNRRIVMHFVTKPRCARLVAAEPRRLRERLRARVVHRRDRGGRRRRSARVPAFVPGGRARAGRAPPLGRADRMAGADGRLRPRHRHRVRAVQERDDVCSGCRRAARRRRDRRRSARSHRRCR